MLRTFLENTSRKLLFRRHLPASLGGQTFYASTEGGLKFLKFDPCEIDPVLLQTAVKLVHTGDTVWDIGANIGLFAFAASGLAGANGVVYAVEPDTVLVDILRRSAALPELTKAPVRVIPVAVSGGNTVAHFRIARRARASNFLYEYGQSQTGGVREEQTVVTVTLDWLAERIPPPQVVKIDTEGAELVILQGAERVLREYRPRIFCEVSKVNAHAVSQLFFGAGYELFDASDLSKPVDGAVWNTVALPV